MKLASVIGVVAVLGLLAALAAGATHSNVFGDVDCDGSVNAVDALKILCQNAGLPVTQTQPCPSIGSTPTASPTPAAPQQREDQITIFSDWNGQSEGGSFSEASYFSIVWSPVVALDTADYPADTSFRYEVTFGEFSTHALCLRLADFATEVQVTSSEICHDAGGPVRHRTGSLELPSGEHDYRIQARCPSAPCTYEHWNGARIIAEWTE